MKIILASNSPRRKTLLEEAGYTITVRAADIDETPHQNEAPKDLVLRLARGKAETIQKFYQEDDYVVLAADTIVVGDDEILGKPVSDKDAVRMLKNLSGKTHEVMTAYCLIFTQTKKVICEVEVTTVTFRKITDAEIAEYVASGEPSDKAGAYAIQGGAKKFVTEIQGSHSNVIGLPMERIKMALPL